MPAVTKKNPITNYVNEAELYRIRRDMGKTIQGEFVRRELLKRNLLNVVRQRPVQEGVVLDLLYQLGLEAGLNFSSTERSLFQ